MAKQLISFEEGAKFRYVSDELLQNKLVPYSSGGQSTMALRKEGLTMGLFIQLTLDVAIAAGGAPVLDEEGAYRLIERIQVILGNNMAQPIDLNSSGLRAAQRQLGMQYWAGFDTPAAGKVIPNVEFYKCPVVANATNNWVFCFYVPFTPNFHTDRHLGILPTASRSFTANLQVDWAKIENVITGASSTPTVSNATAKVDMLTLDVPNFHNPEKPNESGNVIKPKFYIFQRRSTTKTGVSAGIDKIEIPQGGLLLSIGAIIKGNAARSAAVGNVGYVMSGNDQPRTQSYKANRANYAARHKIDLPTGEVVFDLLESSNEGFSGSFRDTVDTTKMGLLEFMYTLNSDYDASVNTAKNNITVVRTSQHPVNVAINF